MERLLLIMERDLRRNGLGNALAVLWRQWRMERDMTRCGVHFRATDPKQVAAAYAAMTQSEFDAVNGRQDWANWRSIPRALSGEVPDRSLHVLDLGCGTGSSTRVLAYYCPVGSHIIGYELAEPLLAFARRRNYRHRSGQSAQVDFIIQAVTETLRQREGQPVADASIDVVNASGVVGHHLTESSVQPLVRELQRILRPGGVAILDFGPTLSDAALTRSMSEAGFIRRKRVRSWCLDPTGQIVFRWPG